VKREISLPLIPETEQKRRDKSENQGYTVARTNIGIKYCFFVP
jgi:hypothetical protein